MRTKAKWIEAYQKVLEEYDNGEHKASHISCAKCELLRPFTKILNGRYYKGPDCKLCLEALHPINKHPINKFELPCPCSNRFSKADSSDYLDDSYLQIEYHKRAIAVLEALPEDENWFTIAQQNLVQIDNDLKKEDEDLRSA